VVQTSDVSPDGQSLLFYAQMPPANNDIFALPLRGDAKPVPIVQTEFLEMHPRFSPDGRWLTYVSSATGRQEVYVQPFPSGARQRVSIDGGAQPMWRQDGRELYFASGEGQIQLYAVDVRPGSTLEFGMPHALFDLRIDVTATRNSYVPSADGQKFLVAQLVESRPSPITVVVNGLSAADPTPTGPTR
jgi:hypothetical protein